MAALLTLFRRILFSVLNLAIFLTSSSISSWSMTVWQETDTDFFTVFMFFFKLAKSWRCFPYTEKYSRDPSKRHQTTHGDFSRETSDCFHPLNFFFLSFVFLLHLDQLEQFETRLLQSDYEWLRNNRIHPEPIKLE